MNIEKDRGVTSVDQRVNLHHPLRCMSFADGIPPPKRTFLCRHALLGRICHFRPRGNFWCMVVGGSLVGLLHMQHGGSLKDASRVLRNNSGQEAIAGHQLIE